MGLRSFNVGSWEIKTLWLIGFFVSLLATILAIVAVAGTSKGWFSNSYSNGTVSVDLTIGTLQTCAGGFCQSNSDFPLYSGSIVSGGKTALAFSIISMLLGFVFTLGAILVTINIGPDTLWRWTIIGEIVAACCLAIGWIVFIAVVKSFDWGVAGTPSNGSAFGCAVAGSLFFGAAAAVCGWARILDVAHLRNEGELPYGSHPSKLPR